MFSKNPLPSDYKLLGEDAYFTEATEPLNILWENRHFTPKDRLIRGTNACLLILLMIVVSFIIISICKSTALDISNTYEYDTCDTINEAYDDALDVYAF